MSIEELFKKHETEYCLLGRIPNHLRPYKQADLCALAYLSERLPCIGDAIHTAGRNQVWLGFDAAEELLTEDDVIYLVRCGVFYDSKSERLSMHV